MVETGPVLVDHRERGSTIPEALVAAGLDVRLADLPVGDYVLGAGLAVERKGPTDLGASIRDGRIFDQAVRLHSTFPQAVLVVEGEPRGIPEDAWRRLPLDRGRVHRAAQPRCRGQRRMDRPCREAGPAFGSDDRTDGPRRSPRHPSAQAETMLSVVPGISIAMARSLLAADGSVAAIAAGRAGGSSPGPTPKQSPSPSTAGPSRCAHCARRLTARS